MNKYYFDNIDFGWIICLLLTFTACRYILIPGISYIIFYVFGKDLFKKYKIQKAPPASKQVKRELTFSISTILVFTLIGIIVVTLYKNNYTTLYTNIHDFGWPYFILSLVIMIVLHDTYFYWTHRILHTKWLFKHIHKIHHQSTNPTPLSAYAFHPIEAFIESLIVFPFIMIFPIHVLAFTIFTFIVLVMNVIGHLGYEFLSSDRRNRSPLDMLTSSTHHNLHHQQTKKNFGYYFTFWDKLMNTLQQNK